MFAAVLAGFMAYRRAKKNKERAQRSMGGIDIGALATGVVPVHGLVSGGRFGFISQGLMAWCKRLLGVVAIASMIAIGLFIYTEFSARWRDRGLPVLPIQALAMASGATAAGGRVTPGNSGYDRHHRGYQQNRAQQPQNDRGQSSLLDVYS